MNALGELGEQYAHDYLKQNGYTILARNFRSARGEIDIICSKHNLIIFVEVKTRKDTKFGQPYLNVNPFKRHKMTLTAFDYLAQKRLPHSYIRFDVLSIVISSDVPHGFHVQHIKNIIEL